ncbi:hypothetical protein [Acidisphaera sp. S103]|uniref:hypothetical protein n=1 Tax=Acidisphaera sp. S103 TaxID=1747223 RepID=UPI00131AFEFD|nr:hypothetical protein [Acidisphaera sp. S103]
MINSEPETVEFDASRDEAVDNIVRSGARGAIVLASIASAIVIGLWIAFYLLVFLPRGPTP